MTRELFVGRNNELQHVLAVSSDGGVTWTPVDLTLATDVILQIYDTPTSVLIEVSGKASFTLDAIGNATWQPDADDLAAGHVGTHNVRWIVKTTGQPQGVVFEAERVQIKQ